MSNWLWRAPADQHTSPSGWFGDPSDVSGATQRWWDGAAWSPCTRKAETALPLPRWKRHVFAFLRHRWFHVLLGLLVAYAALAVVTLASKDNVVFLVTIVVGALVPLVPFSLFIAQRLRLGQLIGVGQAIVLGILGGVSALAIVGCIQVFITGPLDISSGVYTALVGFIEGASILVVPVVLYFFGPRRLRDPRLGLVLVLGSAFVFSLIENVEYATYALTPGGSQTLLGTITHALSAHTYAADGFISLVLTRSFNMHMLLMPMVAAVAWRTWHVKGGFRITLPIVGVFVLAWAIHSGWDATSSGSDWTFAAIAALWAVAYLAFKWAAQKLTPPDAIDHVPPGWRPKHLPTSAASVSDPVVAAGQPALAGEIATPPATEPGGRPVRAA